MDQSLLTPSSSKKVTALLDEEQTNMNQKSQWNGWSAPKQWSRMRKGMIKRRKVISLVRKRSVNERIHNTVPKASCSSVQSFSSEENTTEEIYPMLEEENNCNSGFRSCYLSKNDSQKSRSIDECHITSLSQKYQPKHFDDIVGHEIIVKAISKAAQNKKVARLYLFYGSSGSGKTSTARIFSMALHCESISPNKPCWSCRGCSRSLYVMDLCSGSRDSRFQRISAHLHHTSFTQAAPGFEVIVIEECHLLTAEVWQKLLQTDQSYGASLVFVLITEDATMIPAMILSRCQKFCFHKLKDIDITKKLARILAQEKIEIGTEALKLIVTKAKGSLREAENILDQLTSLGTRITNSTVQQIVGLAPLDKLINLLTTALSGDTKGTIISTKQLIAEGVEAQTIVSQLESLIIDILSSTDVFVPNSPSSPGLSINNRLNAPNSSKDKKLRNTESPLVINQSERLCCALKTLVEYEKQPQCSINQTTWIFKALLQIAPHDVSHGASPETVLFRDTMLDSGENSGSGRINHHFSNKTDKFSNLASIRNMEEIWLNMLEKVESKHMKEFLCRQVKLASLTVSRASVMVHLMFKRPEDKLAAQMSEESISKALKYTIGCPVTINMSLEPVDLEIVKDTVSTNKTLNPECDHSRQHEKTPFPPQLVCNRNCEATTPQSTHQLYSSLPRNNFWLSKLKDSKPTSPEQERCPIGEQVPPSWSQQRLPFSGVLLEENRSDATGDPKTNSLATRFTKEKDHIMTSEKTKHRWLSLSSIQNSDACIEPYSQDILFENANIDKDSIDRKNLKLQDHNLQDSARSIGLYRSWSCKDSLCQRKPKLNKDAA